MKLKFISTVAIGTLLNIFCQAQDIKGSITCVIKDAQNTILEGASVTLLQANDSAVKKSLIAVNGKISFKNLAINVYIVTVTFSGYEKYTSGPVSIDEKHVSIVLPAIIMRASGNGLLREVVVTSKSKLIEQRIDRTIVNVEAMITAAGSNALEVLGKSPGVIVNVDGDISLYGEKNVLVLIDDKPTYLSVTDLAAYLRSLPGGILDKIELISNPPAKYDASGSAIINIRLKKNRAKGFNGNFILGYNQGVYARANDGINVHYRRSKLNLFSNISFSRDINFKQSRNIRNYYMPDGSATSSIIMDSRYVYKSTGWNGRIGADYFISPKATIGIMVAENKRPKKDMLNYKGYHFDASMMPDSTTEGFTDGTYKWQSRSINLNFQYNFDSAVKSISADVDYVKYHSSGKQFSQGRTYLPDNTLIGYSGLMSMLPSDVDIFSIKADYTHAVKSTVEFNTGFKSSFVTTNNNTSWFNQSGNAFLPDYGKTNHFIYKENVNAIYLNATKDWKRWSVQAGLRIENVQSRGHQLGNIMVADSSFTKTYTDVFPTFYLLYKLDKTGDNVLKLTYQKRIRRPNYQQLNPFVSYNDKYNYTSGNPYLKPHYNNFIEAVYSYKNNLGVSFLYGRINKIIQNLTAISGDIFITRPENFGTNYSFNLRPYVSISPLKDWDLTVSLALFHLVNRGNAFGQVIDENITTGEVELNSQFRLGNGWSAEISGFYAGRHIGGQSQSNPFWRADAGIQKSVFKNNGTVKLAINDIFCSLVMNNKTVGLKQVSANQRSESDTRRMGVSFTYRFGKKSNTRKRNHNSGGAGEEQGRVN